MLKGHTTGNSFNTIDFDRATTTGEPGCQTAFGVFSRAHSSEEIKSEALRIFQKYYPLEIDPNISEVKRLHHMKNWNAEVLDVLGRLVDEEQFEKTLEYARQNIKIRGGMREYFQKSYDLGIPTIVFSAGVSNVIEAVLEANEMPYTTVHSNKLGFVDGKLQLLNEGVYIGNKGWISLPEELRKSVSQRTHQLVIGDSIDDIHMGDPERTRSNIGFLISEQIEKGRRAEYQEKFDHVIESDTCDLGALEKIYKQLLAT